MSSFPQLACGQRPRCELRELCELCSALEEHRSGAFSHLSVGSLGSGASGAISGAMEVDSLGDLWPDWPDWPGHLFGTVLGRKIAESSESLPFCTGTLWYSGGKDMERLGDGFVMVRSDPVGSV